MQTQKSFDVIVIGGGQSGLATAYYLRRSGLSYIVLDKEPQAGGAWQHTWQSLKLFSPAPWSSLPGTMMPGGEHDYPTRNEVTAYLKHYEEKYDIPVHRPVEVYEVSRQEHVFVLKTSEGTFHSKAVVSATGTFSHPYIPEFPGRNTYQGKIMHASAYQTPDIFTHQTVTIVGEGNSGAQILAEVSQQAQTLWITSKEPRFLSDHIDGRYLFDAATRMYEAKKQGKTFTPPSLGEIVMVPSVKEARQRGVLNSLPPFQRFTEEGLMWADGTERKVDTVIFCTGYKAALDHLQPLHIMDNHWQVATEGTKAKAQEGLWLVGYGNWTGFASATLIGVGRSAKKTVEQIVHYLSDITEN